MSEYRILEGDCLDVLATLLRPQQSGATPTLQPLLRKVKEA